jgi:hypothetical protein
MDRDGRSQDAHRLQFRKPPRREIRLEQLDWQLQKDWQSRRLSCPAHCSLTRLALTLSSAHGYDGPLPLQRRCVGAVWTRCATRRFRAHGVRPDVASGAGARQRTIFLESEIDAAEF